jgi:hypothetical protein
MVSVIGDQRVKGRVRLSAKACHQDGVCVLSRSESPPEGGASGTARVM